ncbi:MAG: FtsL-like putative cell division protein [Candidatus Kapaibacteriota bacterium]
MSKFTLFKQWFLKNRWKVLFGIFIFVLIIVFWINNVNSVNKLILDNHRLEVQLRDIRSENEELRWKYMQLRSPERIIPYSEQHLGLQLNEDAPIVIQNENK